MFCPGLIPTSSQLDRVCLWEKDMKGNDKEEKKEEIKRERKKKDNEE